MQGDHPWISQYGQDQWIIEVVFAGKRQGLFVDIGAFDGVTISNTYLLERSFGWQGLCVEASDPVFEKLSQNRTCMLENVCLLDSDRSVVFIEKEEGEYSGISECLGEGGPARDMALKSETLKQAATLESVFLKWKIPPVIDYLSIDTEGSEYLILRNFPFHKYRFNAITIEHNQDPQSQSLQRTLLKAHGYVLIKTQEVDDFWLHRNCPRFWWILIIQRLRELKSYLGRKADKLAKLLRIPLPLRRRR